ncbi:MAG: beta-lactamase [Sediminibacterium sp.]|nr:beta-lactamase [Sediminibacterium sp.]
MQRRSFLRNAGLTGGLLALSSKEIFASFLQQSAFKIKMLRGDIGIFTEKGGTIGFYQSPDGWVVIDSQFADSAPHAIDELIKIKEQPFKFLINTHHHGDHTGGNIAFKGIVEHVVGHENCLANYKRVTAAAPEKQLYQDMTFGDSWKQKIGKENIRTYYFGAGHTNGDAIIHFENANIAHMGDLLFNQLPPYIDRTAGANIKNWIQVLQKTQKTFDKDTLFIFGHSGNGAEVTGGKAELAAFEDYLKKLFDFTAAQIDAGKTKEEISKIKDIPGINWPGSGADRSFNAAYDEIMAARKN